MIPDKNSPEYQSLRRILGYYTGGDGWEFAATLEDIKRQLDQYEQRKKQDNKRSVGKVEV